MGGRIPAVGYCATISGLEVYNKALTPQVRDIQFLTRVMQAHMLSVYVIYEDLGRHCPAIVSQLDRKVIDQIEEYVRKFVVVRFGPKGDGKAG